MNFLKSTTVRIVFAALLVTLGLAPAASAVATTSTFQILLDLDNNQTTGCSVATLTGSFPGVEQILITTVTSGGPVTQVTAVQSQTCTNPGTNTFGPATAVPAPAGHPLPWTIGVGNGTGTTDVIETYLPISMAAFSPIHVVRVGVLAFDNGGVLRDEMLKAGPTPGNGPPILLNAAAAINDIPTLSDWGLMLLGLVLAVAAVALLRRRRTAVTFLIALLLLGMAGLAWAAVTCDLDGTTTTEWISGTQLGSETTSDAPVGTDLRAVFGFKDGVLDAPQGSLSFRIDAELYPPVYNVTPVVDPATFSIPENTANATNVGTPITYTDPDAGQTHTFAITAGNTGGAFAIDPSTGQITVANSAALDYETTQFFILTVQVTDNGSPAASGTAPVKVDLTDVNEAPVVTPATFAVPENATNGTTVGTVTFSDPDTGQNHTCAITAGNTGGAFAISSPSPTTCQITVADSTQLDFNTTPTYSLTVQVTDDGTPVLSGTAPVTVNVTDVNDPPVVNGATFSIPENSPNGTNVGTPVTFSDPDAGQTHVFSITAGNTGGAFAIDPSTGQISVATSAALDFETTPIFNLTVQVTDNGSPVLSGTATVTINLTDVDEPPVAVADSATVVEDSGANAIDVLANDTDVDGGPKSVVSVTQPANGVVAITGGGTGVSYTPNANYCNTPPGTTLDTFTYTLTPGSSSTTVTVTVTCVDDDPVAVNDTATVVESSGANAINVLANDTDVDGGPKSVTSVTQPANGVVAITGGGTGVSYTPTAGYCNSLSGTPDTFTYTLTPGGSTATVSVTVTCVDDPPVAVTDAATVNEDSGATAIDVLANDTDVDGGPKSIASVMQPANGAVVITGGGTGLTYTPNADYCNTPPGTTLDTFTYTLTPGGSSATVMVSVTCQNDAPVIDLDADDDQGTGGSDFAATYKEGDPAVLLEDPTDATVTDVDNTTLASLTVTITNVLDPGSEILSTDLTGTSITGNYVPATGTLTLTGPDTLANFQTVLRKIKYQDTDGDPDTTPRVIHFVANDGVTDSNTAVSTVAVVAVDTPPTAVADSATVNEDSGATAIDVLANDTDPDNGPKSITSVTQPANGTVAITGGGTGLTYTPNANYCNTPPGTTLDTFTYTLSPAGSTPTATVTVTVNCVDDNPVAVADSATVTEDDPATAIPVLANDTDVDGGPKSISSVTQPANGTVVITGGGTGLTYQPNANYCNTPPGTFDPFTYTLSPGGSTATVSVTVTCVDDPPVAVNDSATVTEDDPATAIPVLANDTDVDGGSKLILSVTQPANGTVVPTGGGTGLTYKPNANYCNNPPGTFDTFTYTLTPGGSTATVSVSVTCVDDPPVAVADSATVTEDDPATAIPVLANDTDVDGGPKNITSVTQPANGTVAITGGGTGLTYKPNANYCNTPPGTTLETFTYTLTPGGSSATVTVAVTCVNDPPVAGADSFDFIGNTELRVDLPAGTTPAVSKTTPSTFGVLDNDSDPVENNAITVTGIVGCADITAPFGDSPACTTANGGTVVMESTGQFSYKPKAGDTAATDSFQYNIQDNGVPAPAGATGTVTLRRLERVWYVKNDAAAGGLGRSHDPFDTLAEAQAASLANDYIFVYFGDGTTTGQAAGILLKNGQHLIGEHAGLSVLIPASAVTFNGAAAPLNVPLVTAVPGNRPLLDNTAAGGNAVSATDAIPAEVTGFSLAGNANAIDLTTNAAFAGGGTFSIQSNMIRSAGAEGIDINEAGTGALTLGITGNSWNTAGTHTGNAVDINRTGGTLQLNFSSNTNILSAAAAVNINGGAIASTTITGFADNTVHQNTGGTGISVSNAKFDATPGGGYNQVNGGTTTIGISGNGVGGSGMVLNNVSGDLGFSNLQIFADGGSGLSLTGTGTVNVGAGTGTRVTVGAGVGIFEANGGPAVSATSATIDLQLASLKSTNSPTTGVALNSVTGTFSAGSGSSISSTSGTAFQVGNSNATVSYAGTINTTTGAGVSLTSNTGSTISFTSTLTLSTGSNPAFVATGGGTVTSTDTASTLTTTTGTALNVANTTIGSGGLKFRSISANGGANGIVLDTTGSSGGLTVSGSGSAGTGGTIRNMVGGDGAVAGSGIYLNNTSNVSLGWMQLNDFQNFAIRGTNVSGFTLTNSTINGVNGNNDVANEGSISFDELTGSATLTNVNISGGWEDNLRLSNTTGTLNRLTLTNCNVGANSASFGNSALNLMASGTAVVKVTATGCTFTGSRSHHIQFLLNGNSTPNGDLVLTSNTFTQSMTAVAGAGNIFVSSGGNGNPTLTYNIQGNTMRNAIGNAINVSKGAGTGTFSGTIDSNIIGVTGVANSGSSQGNGIAIIHVGGGTHTTHITNNTIRRYNNDGVLVQVGDNTSGGNGTVNATITGNTVKEPDSFALHGLELNIGTTAGDAHFVCASIGGAGALKNDVSGAGNTGNGGFDMRPRQRQSTTIRLPGYAGAATDTAAVATFLTGQNTLSTISASAASNGFVNGAACP